MALSKHDPIVRVVQATTELEEAMDALDAARNDVFDKRYEFREAIIEAYYGGYSTGEIANYTGRNDASIRQQIYWIKEKRRVRDW